MSRSRAVGESQETAETAGEPPPGGEAPTATFLGTVIGKLGLVGVAAIVAVIALVVGLVIGLVIESDDGDSTATTARGTTDAPLVIDVFDDVGATVGTPIIGPNWFVVNGTFAIDDLGLGATDNDDDPSLAIVDTQRASGDIEVTFGAVADGDGLVFRYRDAFNHWRVVAAPDLAAWNVEKVVDGTYTFVASIGPAPIDPGTTVGVQLSGSTVTIALDGEIRTTIDDADLSDATAAGLFADSDTPKSDVRWRSFVVLVRAPLPEEETEPAAEVVPTTEPATTAAPLFPPSTEAPLFPVPTEAPLFPQPPQEGTG